MADDCSTGGGCAATTPLRDKLWKPPRLPAGFLYSPAPMERDARLLPPSPSPPPPRKRGRPPKRERVKEEKEEPPAPAALPPFQFYEPWMKLPLPRGSVTLAGMDDVLTLLHDELFLCMPWKPGAAPGILLHGPPGTGKTLVAKWLESVCGERGVYFQSHSAAACASMYVGEGEAALRALFASAREKGPALLFFDEVDALAPERPMTATSPEGEGRSAAASLVGTLLTLLDGVNCRGQVAVVGATNRPDVLDPALRRPGRLTVEVAMYPPLRAARRDILVAHLPAGLKVEEALLVDLARCTFGYSCADLREVARHIAKLAHQFQRVTVLVAARALTSVPPSASRLPGAGGSLFTNRFLPACLAELVRPAVAEVVRCFSGVFGALLPAAVSAATAEEEGCQDGLAAVAARLVVEEGGAAGRGRPPWVLLRGAGAEVVAMTALEQLDVLVFVASCPAGLPVAAKRAAAAAAFKKPAVVLVRSWTSSFLSPEDDLVDCLAVPVLALRRAEEEEEDAEEEEGGASSLFSVSLPVAGYLDGAAYFCRAGKEERAVEWASWDYAAFETHWRSLVLLGK